MAEQVIYDKDVGRALKYTLTDEGAVKDLTGHTVELLIEGEPVRTLAIISPPTAGRAQYVLLQDDFPAGWYEAQLRVRIGSTIVGHTDMYQIHSKRSNIPA